MLVFVAVAAPVVVAGIAVAFDQWLPLGDLAVIVLRISEVGTRDTPLVGPYSTRFSHPGPLLFWAGAIPYRLAGGDPRAVLVFAAIVNTGCVIVIGWITGRLGGRTLQVLSALGVALLLHDLDPDLLVSPWNPHISVLPFLVLLFCMWAAARGSRGALFGCAVAGAWVVQTHIGYAPLFVALSAWLALWLVVTARRPPTADTPGAPLARPLGAAVALFCLLMSPALVDQLFGQQNLSALWRAFVTSPQERIGIEAATGIVSRFLQPVGPWTGASVPRDIDGSMSGAGSWGLVLVLVLSLGLLFVAWRRHRTEVAVPLTLTLTLDVVAVLVASRISPPAFEYLLQWLHPLAMFTWLVIAWALARLVPWPETIRHAAPVARATVGVAAMVVAVTIIPSAREPEVLDAELAPTVGSVLDQLHASTTPGGKPIRVETAGDTFGQATSGIVYDLIRRGVSVRTAIGRDWNVWGEDTELQPGEDPERTLTIVVSTATPPPGAAARPCSKDPAQRRIAEASAAPGIDVGEFGYRVEVYEGAGPCAVSGH